MSFPVESGITPVIGFRTWGVALRMAADREAVAEALRQAAADPDSALGDCGPIAWTGKAGDEVTIIEGHVDEIAEVAVAALRARDSGDTVTVPRAILREALDGGYMAWHGAWRQLRAILDGEAVTAARYASGTATVTVPRDVLEHLLAKVRYSRYCKECCEARAALGQEGQQ